MRCGGVGGGGGESTGGSGDGAKVLWAWRLARLLFVRSERIGGKGKARSAVQCSAADRDTPVDRWYIWVSAPGISACDCRSCAVPCLRHKGKERPWAGRLNWCGAVQILGSALKETRAQVLLSSRSRAGAELADC